jgi:hypothetical protein
MQEQQGSIDRALALESLGHARELARDGTREERIRVLLASAQVHALLALEARMAPRQPEATKSRQEAVQRPLRPFRDRPEAKDYSYKLENEDEVPERIRKFVELTNNRRIGAAFDLESPSSTLLVAFGGMPGHMGMPPFEFFNISQDLEVKKAYLRDLDRAWYHAGIRGLGDSPEQVAEKLRAVIADAGSSKVVFAGNSAGGWAALLFGALVDVDLVLAFSPQTTLLEADLRRINDQRWDRFLRGARRYDLLRDDLLDLRPVLEAHPPAENARWAIHYASMYELDAFHAERLGDVPGVELDGHAGQRGGHGLIRALRDQGKLREILADAVAERPAA